MCGAVGEARCAIRRAGRRATLRCGCVSHVLLLGGGPRGKSTFTPERVRLTCACWTQARGCWQVLPCPLWVPGHLAPGLSPRSRAAWVVSPLRTRVTGSRCPRRFLLLHPVERRGGQRPEVCAVGLWSPDLSNKTCKTLGCVNVTSHVGSLGCGPTVENTKSRALSLPVRKEMRAIQSRKIRSQINASRTTSW